MVWWSHEEKYVFFRMRELATSTRWELRRLPLVGTLGMLEEALAETDPSKIEKLYVEVTHHLKIHPTWQSDRYKSDTHLLVELLQEQPKQPATRRLLSYFMKRIQHEGVVRIHCRVLRDTMRRQPFPYAQVDILLSSIILELAHQGHSLQWFAAWLGSRPDWTEGFDDFLRRLEDKFGCVKQVPVRVYLQYTSTPEVHSTLLRAGFLDDNEIEADLRDKHSKFFTRGLTCVGVVQEAADPVRAAELARDRLAKVTSLFRVGRKYDPAISHDVLVFDPASKTSQLLKLPDARLRYLKVPTQWILDAFNEQTQDILLRSIYWHAIAAESTSVESKLVGLWTATEFLLPGSGNILKKVVDYVPAIIGLYAVPLMCDYIDQELNRWAQRRNKQAAVTSEERAMTKRERRLKVAHSILRGNEVIPEDEQTGDVLKGAIHQFRSLFQEKNALAAYLNQLQAEVNYDLSRIYRYRNRLVHEAVQANEIAYRLVDRLAFYWSTTISSILFALQTAPTLTVDEVLENRRESWDAYMRMLRDTVAADNLERVVCPENIFG